MPAGARVPAEVRLGSVVVRPATVLAPMAGVTDTVFRRFIRHASLFTTPNQIESHPSGKNKDAARVGHRRTISQAYRPMPERVGENLLTFVGRC